MRTWGKAVVAAAAAVAFSGCSGGGTSGGDQASQPKPAPAPPAVKIVQFYASPNPVARGEKVNLCYGVENATAVRLVPAVEAIDPSPNRCIQFVPARTTTYRLIATGSAGEATQEVAITVAGRAKPVASEEAGAGGGLIRTFAASAQQASPGQQVTLCYAVEGGTSVKIEPSAGDLPAGNQNCVMVGTVLSHRKRSKSGSPLFSRRKWPNAARRVQRGMRCAILRKSN